MNATSSLRLPLCALTAVLSFGLGSHAFAQSVSTTPVGAMTYTFPATTQTTTTYISIPLTNPAVYSGQVASLTTNTITFSGTPFTAGELAQAGSPFFARIAAGPQAGRTMLVTANTTNTITVDTTDNSSQTTALDTSGWALAAGNKVDVIVGDTLASLLGDNTGQNPLLYVGSASAFTADTVGVYNKATSKFDVYYFNTTSGFWRLSNGAVSANGIVIYPETALQINRRSGRSATTLTIVGDVPSAAPLTKTVGGSQVIYSSARYPVDVTLSQLSFTNWTKANSAFTADTVSIYNPTTSKMDTYYQRLDNGQWRKSTDSVTNVSALVIPAGSSITILKRGSVSEATSFLAASLPYTL
jgi:uncharacterized protein (TIGR02597 family)